MNNALYKASIQVKLQEIKKSIDAGAYAASLLAIKTLENQVKQLQQLQEKSNQADQDKSNYFQT